MDLLVCGVESVDCNDTVCLIGEEARSVVHVDYGAAAEDLRIFCGVDGDLLVLPVVEIFGGGVTPMLVSGYSIGWIIWVQLVDSVIVNGNRSNRINIAVQVRILLQYAAFLDTSNRLNKIVQVER